MGLLSFLGFMKREPSQREIIINAESLETRVAVIETANNRFEYRGEGGGPV